jgi:hypothetical protein
VLDGGLEDVHYKAIEHAVVLLPCFVEITTLLLHQVDP